MYSAQCTGGGVVCPGSHWWEVVVVSSPECAQWVLKSQFNTWRSATWRWRPPKEQTNPTQCRQVRSKQAGRQAGRWNSWGKQRGKTTIKEHKEGLATQAKDTVDKTEITGARITTKIPLLLTGRSGDERISGRSSYTEGEWLVMISTCRHLQGEATPTNTQSRGETCRNTHRGKTNNETKKGRGGLPWCHHNIIPPFSYMF